MKSKLAVAALALLAACPLAQADPGYYVVTTYSDPGVRTIDLRYWTVKLGQRPEVIWPELGIGYGVNSRWTTELFVSWEGSSQEAVRISSWNWQNDVLLTQGEWPVDLALHGQLIRVVDERAYAFEFGPVLQTDFGRLQVNANLFLDHGWHQDAPKPSQLKYQWQLRYRALPGLHFGAQGFGELGPWNDTLAGSRQSRRAGPALFGTLPLGDGAEFHLQAAMLYGKVYGRDARMFTLRAHTTF
jgi:hypothetical protein